MAVSQTHSLIKVVDIAPYNYLFFQKILWFLPVSIFYHESLNEDNIVTFVWMQDFLKLRMI